MEPETTRLLITVMASLVAAGLAAGIAIHVARLQYQHQTKLERERRHVANMERLHQALSEFGRSANSLNFHLITKIAYDQMPTKETIGDYKSPTQDVRMLGAFYAPSDVRADLERMDADYNQLAEVVMRGMFEHTAGKMTAEQKTQILAESLTLAKRLHDAVIKAQNELADKMRLLSSRV